MSETFFPEVRTWRIPEDALSLSFVEMRADGEIRGTEGIALWLGERTTDAHVTHVALLRGPGIERTPDFVQITDALLNDVTDEAIRLGVQLVGQIHSHGSLAGAGLSWIDRTGGIRVPSYLSVVAREFAAGTPDINTCGVHVFEPRGWRRMSVGEIAARVLLVPGAVEIITVGASA